jgi:Acetoacetate decarboxylase (ADC)
VTRRETVYPDFIMNASKSLLKAHLSDEIKLEGEPQTLIGIADRMRLFAPAAVIEQAEQVIRHLIEIYLEPGIDVRKLAKTELAQSRLPDLLLPFSLYVERTWIACTARASPCRSIGEPDTTTPRERCAIQRCCSARLTPRAFSPSMRVEAPNFLLKIIPHVDGSPRICELVEYYLQDIRLRGAWTGPAALSLVPHVLAPIAELPVLEIVSAVHILADLTLGLGEVVHDYLANRYSKPREKRRQSFTWAGTQDLPALERDFATAAQDSR